MLTEEFARSREAQWQHLRQLVASYSAHQPVRKIAVVGNAPVTQDAGRAAEIDSSDLVIRMNSLVLDEAGQAPALGTRCDVVVLSHATRNTRWVFHDYRRRLYLAPQAGAVLYFQITRPVSFWPADLGSVPIPNAVIKKPLVDLLDPDHRPGRLTPTSGSMALYLAHEFFPGADLVATGFSFLDQQAQVEWAHHYGGTTAVNKYHDLAREGALLQSWIDDGSVRFLP